MVLPVAGEVAGSREWAIHKSEGEQRYQESLLVQQGNAVGAAGGRILYSRRKESMAVEFGKLYVNSSVRVRKEAILACVRVTVRSTEF